jgi:ORF6N domain-containing protein
MRALVSRERIERTILVIRGHKVMMDADLAELYAVTTKTLNQAVKRNKARFPSDFMFQLTDHEVAALRSQFVTSRGRGGRQYSPYVFTDHLSSKLLSQLRKMAANKAA